MTAKNECPILPLPMHALHCSNAVITIGVWSKKDSFSGSYHPGIYDTIDDSPYIGDRPGIDDGNLMWCLNLRFL